MGAKTSEIGLDSSSKISQNPFELELKTPPTSKNRPESNGNSRSRSPQSWFLPSSEVSAMSGDEPDPDSGFESTTPQAYSEDSQEAISSTTSNRAETTRPLLVTASRPLSRGSPRV